MSGRENQTVENGEGLRIIGQEALELSGEYAKMITFLNQVLKDKGLIFGLSKTGEKYLLTIYEVSD